MLGKKLVKMSPPSLGKFDVEDGVKLQFWTKTDEKFLLTQDNS